MSDAFHMLIDGKFVDGPTTFDVVNPATGEAFAQCPKADSAQLNKAVAAAKAAFPAWSKRPIDERAALVQKLSEALEALLKDFARLLSTEQGKPLDQARYEMFGAIFTLRAFANMRPELKILKDEGGAKVFE